ncbi:serine acetyltransferase [Puniceibacterium sp. IMCC21224]|uniref:serine acetyltransferase n=1 Tax=Puniceibacterium sp. IMCC21224 TaxID=1618204 RepID=UPI00064D9FA1|nr:serine acetyltransferase [Puniceibacterium sp. IMCC21224]KMK65656.1 serine acetyltransferase [Puniceibacterium sp. IMCC21224]
MSEQAQISAQVPDWSREAVRKFWDPGQKLLRAIRRYQACRAQAGVVARLMSKYWVLNHIFWSTITQCEIHLQTQIGGGLRLTHPQGIVIHPDAVIGVNCMIFHQVTLAGSVVLGGHVDIGTGAKLIGPLQVGDDARIGANAVVTRDVAAGTTVAGNPARVLSTRTKTEPPSVQSDS